MQFMKASFSCSASRGPLRGPLPPFGAGYPSCSTPELLMRLTASSATLSPKLACCRATPLNNTAIFVSSGKSGWNHTGHVNQPSPASFVTSDGSIFPI